MALGRLCVEGPRRVDALVLAVLDFFRCSLASARPRRIELGYPRPPILLFTEGAADGENLAEVGIGDVIYDPVDCFFQVCSGWVSDALVDSWHALCQKQCYRPR